VILLERCWICGDLAEYGPEDAPFDDGAYLCRNCWIWESLK